MGFSACIDFWVVGRVLLLCVVRRVLFLWVVGREFLLFVLVRVLLLWVVGPLLL